MAHIPGCPRLWYPLSCGSNDDETVMCFIQDISEQKSREDEIKRMLASRDGEFDHLTGLLRRTRVP